MIYRPYSEREDEFIKKYADKLTREEMGKRLGRSRFQIQRRVEKLGIANRRGPNYTPQDDEKISQLAKEMSAAEIAKVMGKSECAVRQRAHVQGISLLKHGERHHRAVHSDDDVRLVRLLLADGEMNCKEISEKMEMPLTTIYQISANLTRTHG